MIYTYGIRQMFGLGWLRIVYITRGVKMDGSDGFELNC
jgi:hypothetical protein